MFATNRSWPGTSTKASARPSMLGPREAEVDGQPAALLLGQPVGPHAGEPVHERRLAVVDMAGRGYDIHASTAAAQGVVVLRRDRAQVEQAAGRSPGGRRPRACRCAAARHMTRAG